MMEVRHDGREVAHKPVGVTTRSHEFRRSPKGQERAFDAGLPCSNSGQYLERARDIESSVCSKASHAYHIMRTRTLLIAMPPEDNIGILWWEAWYLCTDVVVLRVESRTQSSSQEKVKHKLYPTRVAASLQLSIHQNWKRTSNMPSIATLSLRSNTMLSLMRTPLKCSLSDCQPHLAHVEYF